MKFCQILTKVNILNCSPSYPTIKFKILLKPRKIRSQRLKTSYRSDFTKNIGKPIWFEPIQAPSSLPMLYLSISLKVLSERPKCCSTPNCRHHEKNFYLHFCSFHAFVRFISWPKRHKLAKTTDIKRFSATTMTKVLFECMLLLCFSNIKHGVAEK